MMATGVLNRRLHRFLPLPFCSLLLYLSGTVEIFRRQGDAAALASAAWRTPAATPDQRDFAGLDEPALGNLPAGDDGGLTTTDEALIPFEDAHNRGSTDHRKISRKGEEESPTEALSVSRRSRRSKGAARGLKISAKTLMAMLGVGMALAGTVALLSLRKRWSAEPAEAGEPAREAGTESARKEPSRTAGKETQARTEKSGQLPPGLEDVPVPLSGPGITDGEQSLYRPGSPAVQKVEEEVRGVMERILNLSPSVYASLEERIDALSKAREGQQFEEAFRRLITVAQRAQLMVLDDKLSKLENDVHGGKLAGQHAFLVSELKSHEAFLRSTLESIGSNGQRTVVLLEHRYSQDRDRAGSLTTFVMEETKTLEALASGLERRVALLRTHTGFDGEFLEGLEEQARSASALAKREADEAVQEMEGFVTADIPRMYASTWT